MVGTTATHLRAGLRRAERMRDYALAAGRDRLVAHYEQLIIQYEILIMAAEQREAFARQAAPPDAPPDEGWVLEGA